MSFIINAYRYSGFTGLLDDYGSAKTAYSVRWLNSSYSGALMRIRRSSDNAEKDFYPDSSNELSMSSEDGAGTSLSSWISTDSGYVAVWYDQSGNGNDMTQTTAGDQPRIVNAGSLETDPDNGVVALFCDGSGDEFDITTTYSVTQPAMVLHVLNRASTGIWSTGYGLNTGTNPHSFRWTTGADIYSRWGTS